MKRNLDNPDMVAQKVRTLIMEKLGCREDQLTEQVSFADDLNTDSLDVYELFVDIEKEFSISIPSDDAEKLTSPGSLIHYVESRTGNSGLT